MLKKNPKVSIIVPVYKVEAYLGGCIESILSQTFTDFELLLIDDGSPDKSGEICDEYAAKDERVRVFHQENAGVSAARNLGIEKAEGELIAFVDSDDWVEPAYLDAIVHRVGDSDIMFFAFHWHFEDGCVKTMTYGDVRAEGVEEVEKCISFLRENCTDLNFFGYTWNKVFRSEVIKNNRIKFVEGLDASEDEVFTLSFCIKANRLRIIPNVLYNYRWRYNGLTHKSVSTEKWLLLAEQISGLIESMHTVGLKQIYRHWVFRILLSASGAAKQIKDYLKYTFRAYRYANRYVIRGYKKMMVKNFLSKISRLFF